MSDATNRCGNCRHWTQEAHSGLGRCSGIPADPDAHEVHRALIDWPDTEYWRAGDKVPFLITWPEFGCTMWEARDVQPA